MHDDLPPLSDAEWLEAVQGSKELRALVGGLLFALGKVSAEAAEASAAAHDPLFEMGLAAGAAVLQQDDPRELLREVLNTGVHAPELRRWLADKDAHQTIYRAQRKEPR